MSIPIVLFLKTYRKGDIAIDSIMKIVIAFAIIFAVISFILMVTGKGSDAFSSLGLDMLSDS